MVYWGPLDTLTRYEWYVTISDGTHTVTGPIWSFATGTVTAVRLASFQALAVDGGVEVEWETVSEVDNIGFNLYRAQSTSAQPELLNQDLIPSQMPGSPIGFVYSFLDESATLGQLYYYWLET